MQHVRPYKAAIASLALITASFPTSVWAQYNPAPADQSALDSWAKRDELTRNMKPGDKSSPVYHRGTTGPRYDVRSHEQAVLNLAKYTGTVFTGEVIMERLDPWAKFDGRDSRIGLAKTTIGGKPGVLFALVVQMKGSSDYAIWAVDMPEKTYLEWGGAVRMLALRGVIDTASVFPADMRSQIAAQTHAEQLAFYEAALDKLYDRLSAQAVLSQSQVILRMQELNYDLLFGNDISSPFIGD
ncbi:MAG: hypothetical protein AAF941_06405 [Pseudomonadota bacterium]